MEKLYDRIDFHNNTTPALNESNLNAISKALDDIDDRVVLIAGNVLEVIPQIQAYLEQADDLVEALTQLSQNPPYIGANGNWWIWDTNTSAFVDSGVDASISVTIADVTALAPDAAPYVTNTGTDTDPIFHLFIPRGQTGQNGVGISSIAKTGTSGNVDTYTITLTDGSTYTFTVTNASGGAWNDISGKPFSSIGANLSVTNDVLNATDTTYSVQSASQGGTAESLVTTGEKYNWDAGIGKIVGPVSAAVGATSVTFTDASILTTSVLDLYSQNTSGKMIPYESATVSAGTVTFTIPALEEATTFKLWVRNI